MAGQRVFGPSPFPLSRLNVEVCGGGVYVDPEAITWGGFFEPRRYESESDGALLFPPFTLPPASSTQSGEVTAGFMAIFEYQDGVPEIVEARRFRLP